MQTYVVRVYRARPEDKETIAGVIEDIKSGKKEIFNSLIGLQSKLAHSIERDQLELADLATRESSAFIPVAMKR
jgi:hypothetical protein